MASLIMMTSLIRLVGAATRLNTLRFLVDGWLQTQASIVIELIGQGGGGGGGGGGVGDGALLFGAPKTPRLQQFVRSNPAPLLEW